MLLTIAQAAERLSISRTQAYKLVRDGKLRTISIGKHRRVPLSELDAFIARELQK